MSTERKKFERCNQVNDFLRTKDELEKILILKYFFLLSSGEPEKNWWCFRFVERAINSFDDKELELSFLNEFPNWNSEEWRSDLDVKELWDDFYSRIVRTRKVKLLVGQHQKKNKIMNDPSAMILCYSDEHLNSEWIEFCLEGQRKHESYVMGMIKEWGVDPKKFFSLTCDYPYNYVCLPFELAFSFMRQAKNGGAPRLKYFHPLASDHHVYIHGAHFRLPRYNSSDELYWDSN